MGATANLKDRSIGISAVVQFVGSGRVHSFYATTQRFILEYEASLHMERARRGDLHEADIRLLAHASSPQRQVCQRHILRRKDAERRAVEVERRIDRGEPALLAKARELRVRFENGYG